MTIDANTFPQPVVSVCIANYNGMTVIDECIRSVLAQQGDISIEILVHDDASNDGSLAYIRDQYPQVKLIESTENVGFCVANNRMAAVAKGRYLLLLNNDAALFVDALIALLAEAERLDMPSILSLPQYDAASLDLVDHGCLLDPFFNPVPNLDPLRAEVAMVIGACLWMPKDLWNELGGFPEWFGSIAEDMHLCCRARLAGHAVRVLSASGYRHWQGASFGGNRVTNNRLSTTFRRRALSEKNKTVVMLLTCPSPWVYPILLLHILLLLAEGSLLTVLKADLRFWKEIYAPCFVAVWNQRIFLLGLRKSIQKRRAITATTFFAAFKLMPRKLHLLVAYGIPHIR